MATPYQIGPGDRFEHPFRSRGGRGAGSSDLAGARPNDFGVPVECLGAPVKGVGPRDQKGFALALALLALMVLAGIVSAAVAAAVGQVRSASAAGRVLVSRTKARAGLETIFAETVGRPASFVGGPAVALGSDTVPGGSWRVLDLRLSREFHLFMGEGWVGEGIPLRDVRMAWWMDPVFRVAAHQAVIESAHIHVGAGAELRADSLLAERPGVLPCGHLSLLAGAFGHPGFPASGHLPGPPEWGSDSSASGFAGIRLGWFTASALGELADRHLSESIPSGLRCPTCWLGLVVGERQVDFGESGGGVLVVDGDLTLLRGSFWRGLILASGDVTFRGSSRVLGLVRAGGSVTLEPGSVVDGSACAAFHGLQSAASLARPIPLPGRSWAGPVSPGIS